MKIKFKDIVIVALLLIVFFVVWLFIDERERNRKAQEIIDRLTSENIAIRNTYLNLLEQHLILSEQQVPDVLKELELLKLKTANLNKEDHLQISKIIQKLQSQMDSEAVMDMAKIIEKKLIDKTVEFSTKANSTKLTDLLLLAKTKNWIKPHEFCFGELLRSLRNIEAHDLNVVHEKHVVGLAIFSGIQIIYSLDNLSRVID